LSRQPAPRREPTALRQALHRGRDLPRCEVSASDLSADLFDSIGGVHPSQQVMAEGSVLLRGFARPREAELIAALQEIARAAPFRHMRTPGGHQMSVAMTNCGPLGWITDRSGYRYDGIDPESGKPWPAMPPVFGELAMEAAERAGFAGFSPDAC